MSKKSVEIKACLQKMPKVLVSCRDKEGNNNALAVGYCCNCSFDPPMVMVGIVPSRHSYHMVKETGCFVVNLVTKDYEETFSYLGSHSGKDEDKLAKMNVAVEDGKAVNAPVISDCPVNIECKVVDSIKTGSHEMFVGKIEYVHANDSIVVDNGIDFAKLELL